METSNKVLPPPLPYWEKKTEQAWAELCQAQLSLKLASHKVGSS